MSLQPIGVFDSGIGGLSVLQALQAALPLEHFVYLDDSLYAPYGERDDAHVIARSRAITQYLRHTHGIKALVIACNTATMAAVARLRAEHPDLPIVGVEPGLKPAAAASHTQRVGVIGTRGTVTSAKFNALRLSLQDQAEFVVQPCDGLADAISRSVETQDDSKVISLCADYTCAMGRFGINPGEIDTLVLGCTHYVFAQAHLAKLVGPEVRILSTGEPVARRTQHLLEQAGTLNRNGPGRVQLVTTGEPAVLQAAARRWLGFATDEAVRWIA
ncbi:MAG: glutamate racemase [Rhodoferax sp.]|uniref:glutamate racemase n=1 Tax=Rhodoferax sp. TaxID=50421 RepID=UPI00326583AB